MITLDTSLLIRLLEWAREEAQNDVDLHYIAERLEKLEGRQLSMENYPSIVGKDHKDPTKPTVNPGYASLLASIVEKAGLGLVASQFWNSLSPAEQKTYLKAHPNSKFSPKNINPKRTSSRTIELTAPPSTTTRPASKPTSTPSIRQHLEGEGFVSENGVWSHPISKNKIIRTPSSTHRHHFTVTHRDGSVTRHKTNSDEALKKMISNLAKKPDTSGIGKALTKDKGSLHAYFGKQPGEKLTLGELKTLAESDHPLARRARLVYNVKRAKKRGPVEYEAVSKLETAAPLPRNHPDYIPLKRMPRFSTPSELKRHDQRAAPDHRPPPGDNYIGYDKDGNTQVHDRQTGKVTHRWKNGKWAKV